MNLRLKGAFTLRESLNLLKCIQIMTETKLIKSVPSIEIMYDEKDIQKDI